MAEALPCATLSRALEEPLYGTASRVRGWVLLEQPGPWGREAVTDSRLDRDLARVLDRAAAAAHLRLLLIRRPGRGASQPATCFVAHTSRTGRWLERRHLGDPAELLDLDMAKVVAGERPGFGEEATEPVYLVCTNGRHDQCCANLGRPVARALHGRADGAVWESSHYGGDRFAGNLVCLPHGLYFGRLSPSDALRVVDAYERGIVDLEHYRGRSGEPFAAQAAEHFLRRQEALVGVDDLTVSGYRRLGDGVVAVRFENPGGRSYDVRVQGQPASDARLLSCGAGTEGRPPTYALVEVNSD